MHYVILRDDDTNALTPVECLEHLYRPFLERKLPVNLATIPRVRTDTLRLDGEPEGFLHGHDERSPIGIPITANGALLRYLHEHRGFQIVQHGFNHTRNEFDGQHGEELGERLERGAELLAAAGFAGPFTFVAPYDKYSCAGIQAVANKFRVFSTGWFELRRLPPSWWPAYAFKKMLRRPHWRIGKTLMLSHPGCLLSRFRPRANLLENIERIVRSQRLTVLVTHWWEYFLQGQPDLSFIGQLHQTANWLADRRDVSVISFDDLATGAVSLD